MMQKHLKRVPVDVPILFVTTVSFHSYYLSLPFFPENSLSRQISLFNLLAVLHGMLKDLSSSTRD